MNKSIILCLLLIAFAPSFAQTGLNFDGSDDHISSASPGVTGSAERTIEAWIRTSANSIPGQGGQRVILNWGSMTLGTRYTFCLLFNNAIRIEIGGAGLSGNTAVDDGMWHHVAATYKSGFVQLFVDGVLDTSGTVAGVNTSSGSFVIGRRVDNVNHFEGDLDEIRVWDVALNAGQLASKDSSEYCASPANLIAYYKLNDGIANANNTSISTVLDHSSQGNNGTLGNFALSGTQSNFISSPVLGAGINVQETVVSCGPYTAVNGITYSQSGQYNDTINDPNGCDTILDLNLTVVSVDSSAQRISANTLEANESDTAASFQWLNCNANYQIIGGATGKQFSFVQNGNYAVEVSLNGCVDTSACILISNVGLEKWSLEKLQVYPNPAKKEIKVQYPSGLNGNLSLVDVSGKILRLLPLAGDGETSLNLEGLPQGVYSVQLKTEAYSESQKVLKL